MAHMTAGEAIVTHWRRGGRAMIILGVVAAASPLAVVVAVLAAH